MMKKQTSKMSSVSKPQRKELSMKACKVGMIRYRSRSAYAAMLLQRTKMSDSEIARKVGMTPQTVHVVKSRLMQKFALQG